MVILFCDRLDMDTKSPFTCDVLVYFLQDLVWVQSLVANAPDGTESFLREDEDRAFIF